MKVRVERLHKSFPGNGGKPESTLQNVSFTVRDGTFLAILGPRGCGKSTLLRILGGLEKPDSGTVAIRRADKGRPLCSMVFQGDSLLPWLTAAQNIGYGLRLRGRSRIEQRAVAEHYGHLMGLSGCLEAYPSQLTADLQQRAAIARALANDPEILLMDQPMDGLDEQSRLLLKQALARLWESNRKTVIYATSSIDEAIHLGDQVMVMKARPGRIKDVIPVSIPRPRDLAHLRTSTTFGRLYRRIADALRDELTDAQNALRLHP